MERERITISIKKKILDAIDKTIDGVTVRNRSHAFETIASKALNLTSSKNAAILIGGKDALKCIPQVQSALRKLAENDFKKVYVAVGFLAEKIKAKLGDGSDYGLSIKYIENGEGTGGSTLLLKKFFDSTFIVMNALEFEEEIDLNKMIDFHRNHNGFATIVTDNIKELNGLYILEPAIFDLIPKGFSMLETDIFPKLLLEDKVILRPLI